MNLHAIETESVNTSINLSDDMVCIVRRILFMKKKNI